MKEKNLPIKIFEKRKVDEMLTEAGGGDREPKWVLKGDQLYNKVASFKNVMSGVEEELSNRKEENNFIPVVLNAIINDKAIAKSYRNDITKLFDVNNKHNTIGLADENTLLVKIDNPDDLNKINGNIDHSQKNAYGLSAIDELEIFEAIVDIENNEHIKVKLFDFQDYELNRVTRLSFERYCNTNDIRYIKSFYASDLLVYRIDKPSTDVIKKLMEFDGVFSIVDMPVYNISFDMLTVPDKTVSFKKPQADVEYPIVGVLDSGISKIDPIMDWLHEDSYSNFIEDDIDRRHGTFVAGILLDGDELQEKDYTGFEGCKIFDATIAPKPEIMKNMIEDELINNISSVINSVDYIKIWTLSAGSSKEADLNIYSDFGVALDKLQEENDVIICKSAGNCLNFTRNAPKSRISRSADSVRSLVIGSIAHEKGENDQSEVNEPSPFTRIGYAPGGIIKPDLVHYGGNAGVKNDGNISMTGVNSFTPDGVLASNIGTSFSTPRIASVVAGLSHKLKEEFDPLLLKALAIHSAKYPQISTLSDEDKLKQLGFGIPSKIDEIIYNDQNEITLILQDTLEKGKYIDIMDFPYPNLMKDGFYYGEITVTLVTSPILDHTQGAEYCQSNIDVYFGTYDQKITMEGRTIRNPIRRDGSINLLNKNLYSVKSMKENTDFKSERMLRNFHQKYQPVKKWSVNLDEFKPTPKEIHLLDSKKWFLKLNGLYRANAESKNQDLSQDFCLIITIKDPKNEIQVYDQVSQKLNQLNFIQKNIQLRDEIRLKL